MQKILVCDYAFVCKLNIISCAIKVSSIQTLMNKMGIADLVPSLKIRAGIGCCLSWTIMACNCRVVLLPLSSCLPACPCVCHLLHYYSTKFVPNGLYIPHAILWIMLYQKHIWRRWFTNGLYMSEGTTCGAIVYRILPICFFLCYGAQVNFIDVLHG